MSSSDSVSGTSSSSNETETGAFRHLSTTVPEDLYGDSSSSLFRSLSMSQNLAFSVVEEVPHMIHLNSHPAATASSSSSMITQLSQLEIQGQMEQYSSVEEYYYRHKDLKASKSVGVTSFLESTPLPTTIPPKRTTSMGKRNDILIGIVVSKWDNIVGPQCSYLWTEEMTSLFYPGNLSKHLTRLLKYVTDHTVDHHEVDGNIVSHSTMKSGLCIVPDLNLVYMSLSIRVPQDPMTCEMERVGKGMTVPHSVSVLAYLQYLQHFLLMRPLITNWLTEFSPKIGVLICKNMLHMSMINSWCAELCKTMAAVRTCWWQKNLTAKSRDKEIRVQQDNVNPVKERFDYLPPPLTSTALEMMLTSHLSTSCSSIIIGPDAYAINQEIDDLVKGHHGKRCHGQVIRFLLCFSKQDEGYCSRYVLPTLPDTFMKGLYVQGLISGEIGEKSISGNQVNSNRHPFTHVELNPKFTKVRQMPVQSHQSHREITLVQELTALWHTTTFISSNTEFFPQHINDIGGFVSKFLTELQILRPERRYGRLLLFRRMLHAKALSLITYLQSIQFKPQKEKSQLTKRVKEILCLDEAEFLIIQMTAEKIRPGVLSITRS